MNAAYSGPSAVAAAGVRKEYGDRSVLRGVDLSIPWGQTVVLFGTNGAGKTTLLRILAGLSRPDEGSVHIAGQPMRRSGGRARTLVGFVGHQTLLYNDLTCHENLAFYAKLYSVARPKRRVESVLEQLNLSDRADRRVRTLSHGMQKRLSVARAILHEPAVLLLDEPESGLDAESVASLGDLLRDWSASGRAALLTTHSYEIGQAWSDRVLTLDRGRVSEETLSNRDAVTAHNGSNGDQAGG